MDFISTHALRAYIVKSEYHIMRRDNNALFLLSESTNW